MSNTRWLTITLVASLGLNLALVGFIAGKASHSGMASLAPDPFLGAFRMLRELPEARRDALRPVLREHFKEIRPDLKRLRDAHQDVGSALAAEPYAPEPLAAALARFRMALLAGQEHSHRALVQIAEQMTPGERRQLLEVMSRHPRGHQPPPVHRAH